MTLQQLLIYLQIEIAFQNLVIDAKSLKALNVIGECFF